VTAVTAVTAVTDGVVVNVKALDLSQFVHRKVLFISAHPDDIEICSGGLVSLLTQQGTEVAYTIVTNGDKGCGNPFCQNYTSKELTMVRAGEAMAAAKLLGVDEANLHLLDYQDAQVTSYSEEQIRKELVRIIRAFEPFAVMSWYPYPRFELLPSEGWDDLGYHPDHQAVGKLVLDACFDARVERLFPGVGQAWPLQQFYMWEFVQPTHYLDIGAVLEQKVNAYLEHHSQYPDPSIVRTMISWLGSRIANISSIPPTVKFAEGFRAFF